MLDFKICMNKHVCLESGELGLERTGGVDVLVMKNYVRVHR